MSGLPRIGKSSWIENNKKDSIIVSPDIIRFEIFGHQHHAMANDYIFTLGKSMTYLLLLQGKSVIIDATNIRKVDRENWFKVADSVNKTRHNGNEIHFEVVTITTGNIEEDINLSIEHNKICPKDKAVPESVIKGMASNMTFLEDETVLFRCENFKKDGTGSCNSNTIEEIKCTSKEHFELKNVCTKCRGLIKPFRPLRKIVSTTYNSKTQHFWSKPFVMIEKIQ